MKKKKFSQKNCLLFLKINSIFVVYLIIKKKKIENLFKYGRKMLQTKR